MPKFNVGDRAKVNDTIDFFSNEIRTAAIGMTGTITDQLEDDPECVWFTPDTDVKGLSSSWALLDTELDSLED